MICLEYMSYWDMCEIEHKMCTTHKLLPSKVNGLGLPSSSSLPLDLTLRKSTSKASPNECAGSVLTINTFKSEYCGEDANSTANADDMDVLPTPPFPPTKITGVSELVESEEEAVFAISSINGCNEYSLVVVDGNDILECTTVLDDGKDLL